ncbi:MAG: hypothetical protein Q9216_005593 [Gyalolechia sp. 2 TL-2023]
MEKEPHPPWNHDISWKFQPAGGKNLGGAGCFNAGVYVVRGKATGKKYIEKKFKGEDVLNGAAEFEMLCLLKLRHKNIVQYVTGFIIDEPHQRPVASVYLEYCDMGNLHDYVEKVFVSGGLVPEAWIWDIFIQLVDAIAFMHLGIRDACRSHEKPRHWIGFIHRDIKLDNVFLCSRANTDRVHVRLGDFGQAIREDDDGTWGRHYKGGNVQTAPPEVAMGGVMEYSMLGDVWALGCCISLVCQPPVSPKRREFAGPYYSRALNQAIQRLMQIDPHKRPLIHVFARKMLEWRDLGLSSLEFIGLDFFNLATIHKASAFDIIARTVVTLSTRSSGSHVNAAIATTTHGGAADHDSKKRKLTNGVSSQHDHKPMSLEDQLESSLDAIHHRGPDSHGTWISPDGDVGLGSCRLEINGLGPGGQQPFSNKEGTIHAVVNGELYDHQRIRDDMIKRSGYKFKGGSDSEIVMALYEHHGISFLSQLRGEFALCIYDARRQLLLAARDRSGIKPLFWTVHDGKLLLASEAKALLPFGWQPQWDVRSIIDKGWLTEERTIFKGLRKIRPGYYLTCLSFDHIADGQYWDHDYPEKQLDMAANFAIKHVLETRTEEAMIEGVRSKMLDAVRVRLQADVPVGIHLSGGIDSAVIAGMAKHLLDKGEVKLGSTGSHHLRCLGIAFDMGSGFDESVIAQNTADFLGVDFQRTHMDEAALAANFEEAVWFDEQPHFDLGFVGKHALSKLTRDRGIKTIISGQGSDEIFGGYDVFLEDYLREPDYAWPNNQLSEPRRLQKLRDSKTKTADGFATWTDHDGAHTPTNLLTTSIPAFAYTLTFPHLPLSPGATAAYGALSPQETLIDNIPLRTRTLMSAQWHPLHSAQYLWNKTALPNLLLTNLSDRTEMSHSIEGRVPFLDHHLIEYVNSLPPSMKIRYDAAADTMTEKWILRQAARPFVTDEIFERKKHPYSAPNAWPVGGPMYSLMAGLVCRENVEALGFVDWGSVEGLVERAFGTQDQVALRSVFGVAQWVVLGRRFGVPKAVL